MIRTILKRGIHHRVILGVDKVPSHWVSKSILGRRFGTLSVQFSPNTEEPNEVLGFTSENGDKSSKESKSESKPSLEAAETCSGLEAGDTTTPLLALKRRIQRGREKAASSVTYLDLSKLKRHLQFREATDAPCLSQLPALPSAQWNQARLSLLSCLNYPISQEKTSDDASNLFTAGDSLLIASVYPGSTYFLDSLVEHLAHSVKSSVLSFNVQDLQSMDFVNRAFPKTADSALPIYPDSKSIQELFSNSITGAERADQESDLRREEEDDEDEEDEDDYDLDSSKSSSYYTSESPGFLTFISSDKTSAALTSEDLSAARRLRKGFFHIINDASWDGAEKGGLVIHFRDAISSLLDRASHVVIRGLYQAIQDYRVASGRKVALVVTTSPSFLDPLMLKHNSFADVTRRFMNDIGRSDWARQFTLVNIHPHLQVPDGACVDLQPEGATAITCSDWLKKLDLAYKRRAFEINIKNLHGLCWLRGLDLAVNYDPSDLAWSGQLASLIWPKMHLVRLASALTGYSSESLGPLDRDALAKCLQLIPFPEFEAVLGGPAEGGKSALLTTEATKFEAVRRACDSYERKLLGCVVNPESMAVGFDDIRMAPQTITTLQNLITLPLLRPSWFSTGVLARHFISGVLLFGPPGTGKTLLAKAVAKESGSTVLEIKGSDVYNKYVGEGEKAVQAIFSLARRLAPCVVFVDEVDALFGSRRNDSGSSGRREIINQFMLEWDGLTSANKGIMIMAATNRPFDLDDAILRRLPRRILVDLPTLEDRQHILRLHLRGETLAEDLCLASLAGKTEGYSGSDLKNLCVSAAVAALQDLVRIELGSTAQDNVFDLKKLAAPTQENASRILTSAHFTTALAQINASISDEMGSVLELRKWDKLYGDGAKARSKKLAFGFGAATPSPIPSTFS